MKLDNFVPFSRPQSGTTRTVRADNSAKSLIFKSIFFHEILMISKKKYFDVNKTFVFQSLSIINYDVSKHYAGSQVSDFCPLGYLFFRFVLESQF